MNNTDIKIITPNDGAHYFFAYYDMRATGKSGKHLCHRVPFMDRLPTPEDVCEVGYLEDGKFIKFGETTAWNFQQGAMLQYHPDREDTVFYNVCEDGKFYTLTHNFVTGEKKYADRPSACISPDGKWGLAVNFGRIYAFRPGYGYAGFVDEYADVNAPAEDGVFLVDMEKGSSKQIVSCEDLARVSGFDPEDKILINHITFNTASDRFLMLVRNFPGEKHTWWTTSVIISDREGNIYPLLKNTYFSHYHWRNERELVAHCTVEGNKQSMYIIDVVTGKWTEYDLPYFVGRRAENVNSDIHCCFSPDGNYIIGDGYCGRKDDWNIRYLVAYSMRTGESRVLFGVDDNCPDKWSDTRCDLHARFVWGGSHISFDTTMNGRREVALISADVLDF